jgi:hypothetical protein
MSDQATDSQPSRPFFGTLADVEIPPQTGYVVFQVIGLNQGAADVWAWCRVVEGHPGFDDVVYTRPDGVTLATIDGQLRLGPVLFKVFC